MKIRLVWRVCLDLEDNWMTIGIIQTILKLDLFIETTHLLVFCIFQVFFLLEQVRQVKIVCVCLISLSKIFVTWNQNKGEFDHVHGTSFENGRCVLNELCLCTKIIFIFKYFGKYKKEQFEHLFLHKNETFLNLITKWLNNLDLKKLPNN